MCYEPLTLSVSGGLITIKVATRAKHAAVMAGASQFGAAAIKTINRPTLIVDSAMHSARCRITPCWDQAARGASI